MLDLSNHHFEIFKNYEMLSKEDIKQIKINETYMMINNLTGLIYDVKDKADKNKNDMKNITKNKIPELVSMVE